MKFIDLTKAVPFKPVTLAQAILYKKGSAALHWVIKQQNYTVDPDERRMLVQIASGKKTLAEYYPELNADESTTRASAA